MPGKSIADLILSGSKESDDFDLEDEALARELEELKAKRRAADKARYGDPDSEDAKPEAVTETAPEPSPAASAIAEAVPENAALASSLSSSGWRTTASASGKPPLGSSKGLSEKQADSASAPRAGRSLADAILSSGGSGNQVDKELEAMENELEQKLQALRSQQSSSSAAGTAAAPAKDEARRRSPSPPVESMQNTLRSTMQNTLRSTQQGTSAFVEGANSGSAAESEEELAKLRNIAAKMEEVFPEPSPPQEGNSEASLWTSTASEVRSRRVLEELKNLDSPEKNAIPADEECMEMRSALENLDFRLKAMHSKQALQMPKQQEESQEEAQMNSKSVRLIEEMRAQNRFLREKLSSERKHKTFGIDRSLFTGGYPAQVTVPVSPAAAAAATTATTAAAETATTATTTAAACTAITSAEDSGGVVVENKEV
eukprot:TRINITY_DN13942_c0_g1_i1.p1 TRINITY_DN13942_c0_g1~~TRINITY_DN13942_c0_g1_i1.p1  ORF type:complete len:430 (+),score=144.79 TRINITY_DN13942_c0_g1_i1:25-1314(+)